MRTTPKYALTLAAALAAAALPAFAQSTRPADDMAQTEGDLPEAREVIDRSIEATGGEDVIRQVESIRMTGSFGMMGMEGPMTILSATRGGQPAMKATIEIPGMGQVVQGLVDGTGYSSDPMQGARLTEEAETASFKEQADPQSAIKVDEYNKSYKTVGRDEVDGTPVVVVEFVDQQDNTSRVYYATEGELAGLPVRADSTQASPMGEIATTTRMTDYREVQTEAGPMMQPFKIEVSAAGQQQVITLEQIEVNPELDADALEPPAEVKELMDGQ